MAEEFGQSKSFAPTPRRREEARKQGQIAVSMDLTNSVQLAAGVVALWCGASAVAAGLLDCMRIDLGAIHFGRGSITAMQGQFISAVLRGVGLIGFLIGILVLTGLATSMAQAGFRLTPELLMPRWSRVSFATGWERNFSRSALMRAVLAVLKVAVVTAVAAWVLRGRTNQLRAVSELNLSGATAHAWNLAIRLALAIAGALVILGAADYLYQRWRVEQALMMTAQEMKEQLREDEGDPQTRARLKRLAREATKNRQLKDVPSATVVVTNPTHLAIALRYDRGMMPAPRVVAKGSGALAKRIADLARRHGVPVLERKPLARALFKAVKVGQDIPGALYYAVAEVLAYVYRLRS